MFSRKIHLPIMLIMIISLLFLSACSKKVRQKEAELDTPEHHVTTGNKMLKFNKLDEALREFNLAIELSPKFAPAHVGVGLVLAYQGDFEKAMEKMENAEDFAQGDEQEADVHIGFMRLYTMGKETVHKKWLKKTESHFEDAVDLIPNNPAPYYYMGMGYKMAHKYNEAKENLSKVLEMNGEFTKEANREFETIQNVERAMPGAKVREIALHEKVSRADIAALFIEELRVDELYRKLQKKEFDTSFKGPEKEFVTGQWTKIPDATDIENHVLKNDIIAFLDLGIKGLEAHADHTFQPNKYLTRAEFAMLIQDILITIIGDDELDTKFFGDTPVFPDLRSDMYYYNAVMVCSSRGILKAKDFRTGEFDPMGTISGAEALIAIRELKNQLSAY